MLIPAATTKVKMQARTYETGHRMCPVQNTSHSYPSSWSARHLHLEMYWFCSVAKLCLNLCNPIWTAAHQVSLSVTISQSLLKLMSLESVMPSNRLIFCHSLLLLPSIFPSIRVFSSESALPIRSRKYWNISFSISPSNEYSGLISFRIDGFDLLAVQGTLKSLL